MRLTKARIETLTPIVRSLARRFEAAGKRVSLDVEDLEQEGWIVVRALRESAYTSARHPNQYLSRSILHRLIRLTARPHNWVELDGHDREDDPPPTENTELTFDVGEALESLTPRQARMVRLYFGLSGQALSMPRIATVCRCSVGTVHAELSAARLILERHPLLKGRWLKASSSDSSPRAS